jgi:uncharacterized protein (TIGR03118 family)
MMRSRWIALAGAALAVALATAGTAAGAGQHRGGGSYTVTSLVSDQPGVALVTDPNLVNAWGVSEGPTTPWWVANNGTKTSTLYDAAGTPFPLPPKAPLVVQVPGAPTGTVFYGGTQFLVSNGTTMVSAKFIFATEAGTIEGWPPGAGQTVTGFDGSKGGAVYKGLATAGDWLYAADFVNARVDIIGGDWKLVKKPGAFHDPKLPKGYAPFGIQALAGSIFVTYAKQDGAKKDEVAGDGLGYVDQFTPDGQLVARVASGGRKNAPPNAPWGLALAPASFGVFSGDILVGNFGNGRVSAYQDRGGGKWVFKGQLRHGDQTIVTIDGLWAIAFGNGSAGGPTTTLYFAAGPSDEAHGLFGSITAG